MPRRLRIAETRDHAASGNAARPATAARDRPRRLAAAAAEARTCTRCDLYKLGTQTVFGAGDARARLMLVGEQPGDVEDRQGVPFVGPAGRLLDEALAAAGLDQVPRYVTNAVKHFKWEPRGKRRIHKKPSVAEMRACHVWLETEIAAVGPDVIVALGATAARAIAGPGVQVLRDRGRRRPAAGPAMVARATRRPHLVALTCAGHRACRRTGAFHTSVREELRIWIRRTRATPSTNIPRGRWPGASRNRPPGCRPTRSCGPQSAR